ncbi:MAG TPA: serine/threonine-protein kinase, partial [Phycisphaerae bacterium]|nr:serine/threonine-protein kinase [Phycisphaerae bacterium]
MPDRAVSSCPTLEETELFVQQGGDERIRRHLEECPACRQLVHEIQANNSLICAFRAAAHDQPETAFSSIPERIGGYRLLREIHRGGQGIIYKAVHVATRRIVAIKMLAAGSLASPRQRNRFEREIEIIAGLRHAHLVTLFETLELPDARTAFAMEFVDGLPLDQWIEQSAASLDGKLRLFMTICDAVAYAHQHGIIHRDLKPGNILVDHDGRPHILDFGLAKALGSDQFNQTQTGEFLGTFAYAAPEQVQGDPQQIDTRTDVYALGMILYEMLADCRPYPESGPLSEMLRFITRVDPPRPSTLKSGLDDELDTIVCKALAKDPARRYHSVAALSADIQHYLDGQPLDAKRD